MLNQNFHTHSRFSDGHDSLRALVEEAIARDFTALGFSDHSYLRPGQTWTIPRDMEARYLAEARSLAAQYRGKIALYAGLELDAESALPTLDWDFVIASVHELARGGVILPIDGGTDLQRRLVDELFGGDWLSCAEAYFERLTEHVMRCRTDIVGHIDLPAKYSLFPEDEPRYRDAATAAVREIVRHCPVFEMNTGAMARGLRSVPYPAPFLLEVIRQAGGAVIVTSDCHYKAKLAYAFDEAEAMLLSAGFFRDDHARLNERIQNVTLWRAARPE